jgi:hypothetical protein
MHVCVRLFCVCDLCVDSGIAMCWSPVQGVLPTVEKIKKLKKKAAEAQQRTLVIASLVRRRNIPTDRPPLGGFLDRSRSFFIQVAPQLSSWGSVDPVPDPYFSENQVGPGIKPGTSGSVARNSDR